MISSTIAPIVASIETVTARSLDVGGSQTTVTVEANTVQVNTTTGDVSHTITTSDLQNMPLLTKNAYALIGLAAGHRRRNRPQLHGGRTRRGRLLGIETRLS